MKYELVDIGIGYRPKALKDFGNVLKGELGGILFSKDSLSQDDESWLDYNSSCSSISKILGDSTVINSHIVGQVIVYNSTIENSIIQSSYDDIIRISNSSITNTDGFTGNCTVKDSSIQDSPFVCIDGIVMKSYIKNNKNTLLKLKEIFELNIKNDGELNINILNSNNSKLSIEGSVIIKSSLEIEGDVNLKDYAEVYGNCKLRDCNISEYYILKSAEVSNTTLDGVDAVYNISCQNSKYDIVLIDKYYRVRALRDIGDIAKKGDIGGIIDGYGNLDIKDDSWIMPEAMALYNSKVTGNSLIKDKAIVAGNSVISNSIIEENAKVGAMIKVSNSNIKGDGDILGRCCIEDSIITLNNSNVLNSNIKNRNCIIENSEIIDN